jgi:hypothetical protein
MMKKGLILFLAGCLLIISNMAIADSETQGQKAQYENILNHKIECCLKKAERVDSKSANIRQSALMNSRKAEYFKENKSELLEEMAKQNVGVNAYKVSHYLNKEFFNNVAPGKSFVAEAYSSKE